LLFPLVAASCSSTTLTTVWYNQDFEGSLQKALVIGMAQRPATRRFFEDDFARELAARGTQAVPSYTILPSLDTIMDEGAVQHRIEGMGIDAVLITRLLDTKTVEYYYPPEREYRVPRSYYGGWYSYYADGYERVTRPGYVVEQKVVTLETNLYGANREELIYSAISDTVIETTSEDAIKSFIATIVQDMAAKGIIGPIVSDGG
jgi:hypothetical protein